jgi:glycosyltransferase involved in cell wall biosynthesis
MQQSPEPLRVVKFMEAASVTGPAANVIRFCKFAHAIGEVKITIAAFHRSATATAGTPWNAFFDALASAGIEFDVIREKRPFDPGVIEQMREIVSRRNSHIVASHAVKSHFLVRLAGLHRRYRWIAYHHGYTAENLKVRLYTQLDRWSLPAARRVVTVCGPFATMLADQRGVRPDLISVLPNSMEAPPPPDPGQLQELSRNLGLSPDSRVILSIGRLSSEKAQIDLLQAFALMKTPNLRLVLVGNGIDRGRLEHAAATLGIAGQTVFAGQHRNVWPFYNLADIFVLPSLSEGSPNVLLEAMMAQTPIVATAVGGVPETVENEASALLVPPRDPEKLAEAMRRLLDSPELRARLTANAFARVKEDFSPRSYYERCHGIQRSVFNEP